MYASHIEANAARHQQFLDDSSLAEREREDELETLQLRILQIPRATSEVSAALDWNVVVPALDRMINAYKGGSVGADIGALDVFCTEILPAYEEAAEKLAEELIDNPRLARVLGVRP